MSGLKRKGNKQNCEIRKILIVLLLIMDLAYDHHDFLLS